MVTSIGAGFLSRLFSANQWFFKAFKMEKKEKKIGWKKSLDRKPDLSGHVNRLIINQTSSFNEMVLPVKF